MKDSTVCLHSGWRLRFTTGIALESIPSIRHSIVDGKSVLYFMRLFLNSLPCFLTLSTTFYGVHYPRSLISALLGPSSLPVRPLF